MAEHKIPGKDDLPNNSYLAREGVEKEMPTPNEHKIKPVVKGKIRRRRQSFFSKFGETFFGESTGGVGEYILWDVLVPNIKDTIKDVIFGGIEMLLYGELRGGSRLQRDRGKSYVSYEKYSKSDRREETARSRRRASMRGRVDDLVIEEKNEAEDALDGLVEVADQYDYASVSNLYELLNIPTNPQDTRWGWSRDALAKSYVERVRGGYAIILPNAVELDD